MVEEEEVVEVDAVPAAEEVMAMINNHKYRHKLQVKLKLAKRFVFKLHLVMSSVHLITLGSNTITLSAESTVHVSWSQCLRHVLILGPSLLELTKCLLIHTTSGGP